MQVHILSRGQSIFLLKEVMLHLKLNGIELRAPCKHMIILSLHTLSSLRWGEKVKSIFFW